MTLEKRIAALESKLLMDDDEQPGGVFINCVDKRRGAPPPGPVKGWRRGDTRIMRMEGETDEELSRRAIAEMKPLMAKNAVPVFHSIRE
jgi:hypothetical protein